MLLTLITKSRLHTLILPERAVGRYRLCEEADKENERAPFFTFEAIDGSWSVKPTRRARLVLGDDEKAPQEEVRLEAPSLYRVHMLEDDTKAVMFCEPLTDDRVFYRKYVVDDGMALKVGRGCDNAVVYERPLVSEHHAELAYRNRVWLVKDRASTNGTFVNGVRIAADEKELAPGDVVWILGLCIIVGSNFLACNDPDGLVRCDERLMRPFKAPILPDASCEDQVEDEEEPDRCFYRSPRFCRTADEFKLKVDPPPAPEKENQLPVVYTVGPALTMGFAMVFSASVMAYNTLSNGNSILSSLPMMVMACTMLVGMVLWPIMTKKFQRRLSDKNERKRRERYREYLDSVRTRIEEERERQAAIAVENNPTVITCMNRAFDRDRSLWERTADHDDFLAVRIGIGDRDLNARIEFPPHRFTVEEDGLQDALSLLEREPKLLKEVPISFGLRGDKVSGVIGPRECVLAFARGICAQLATLHSYDELKLCFISDERELPSWRFARWLPHSWDDDMQQRYFANSASEMREMALFLEPLIQERSEECRNGSRKPSFEPQYLIVAANRDLFEKTELLDLLSACEDDIGMNALLLFDELQNLPKECDTVIDLGNDEAVIYNQHDTKGEYVEFEPDIAVGLPEMERASVALANIKLNLSSQRFTLPKALTFLEMYGVSKVEHLNSATRWKENNPSVSLAVPVGVAANGDPFMLDLHEKIHGPHGLVAGMTGSGKSEFVITYLLSIAVNFHPDEVAFILIDYKGGGLAGAFDNDRVRLPHVAGTITNLDGAAIDRSLVSIQSELRRRQAVFNEARDIANEGTMDIYKYQQLYRAGTVSEPVPHLLIVSDEFAELKQQQPDFMDQLISTARIGRSLGVHLILATQKPNGVVNDQIRSNAKFKVCLKVQDRADSLDMINKPDAASLVETGRFYLQVGYNEFFALGQSAWTGAPYFPSDRPVQREDRSIIVINDAGRSIMQAKSARSVEAGSGSREIVAVIDYVTQLAADEEAEAAPLWLPPIPPVIHVEDVASELGWAAPAGALEACIGMLDDPFHQDQRLLTVPFATQGNVIVCGAAGSGKNLFVCTLLQSLLSSYDASHLNVYLADFGSGSLKAFAGAPQVGDVATADDAELVVNLLKLLMRELKTRKKLFAKKGAMAFEGEDAIPQLLVVIENIAAFYELYEPLEPQLNLLTREGTKYGLYFLVTELASNNMRYKLMQNFGQTFVLHVNDPSDYATLLGGAAGRRRIGDAVGRGLVKRGDVYEFQTAHPFSAKDYHEGASLSDLVALFCEELGRDNVCEPAKPIPILPESVTPDFLSATRPSLEGFPLGVSKATLNVVRADLAQGAPFVIGGNDWDGIKGFETGFVDVLGRTGAWDVVVLDPSERFEEGQIDQASYISGQEACAAAFLDGAVRGEPEALARTCWVINSLASFVSSLGMEDQKAARDFFEHHADDAGVHLVLCDTASDVSTVIYESWMQRLSAHCHGVWVGDGVAEQRMMKLTRMSNDLYAEVSAGFGYVVCKGKPTLTKLLVGEGFEAGDDVAG